MNAVVGGIRSHRRTGMFLNEQLQAALDELVQSADVLAGSVSDDKGQTLLSAGRVNCSTPPLRLTRNAGARRVAASREFRLSPTNGMGPGMGMGMGMGTVGRRCSAWPKRPTAATRPSPKAGSYAVLLVDRDRDRRGLPPRRLDCAARSSSAGWLVVLCVALAWRATVRLAEARGRAPRSGNRGPPSSAT